jgi:hypothetical protein
LKRIRKTVTKGRQRGDDCDQREDVARVQNPVKRRVVFRTNEFVIISNPDQETQIKPETSEEILESSDVLFGDSILKLISSLWWPIVIIVISTKMSVHKCKKKF